MRRGLIGGGVLAALWFLCGWAAFVLARAGGSLATLGQLIPHPMGRGVFGATMIWAIVVQLLMAIALVAGYAVIRSWLSPRAHTFAAGWLAAILIAFAIGAAMDVGSAVVWFGRLGVRGALNTMGAAALTTWWAVVFGWIPALIARHAGGADAEDARGAGRSDIRALLVLIAAVSLVALPIADQAGREARQQELRQDRAAVQNEARALADPDGAAPRDPDAQGEPVPESVDGSIPDGACTTSNTTIMAPGFDAATGHRGLALHLVNSAETACTLNGYPDVAYGDQNEHLLDVTVAHGGSFMAQDQGPAAITLRPGESATAVIGWDANSVHGQLAARHLWAAVLPGDKRLTWDMAFDIIPGSTVHVTAWRAGAPNAS